MLSANRNSKAAIDSTPVALGHLLVAVCVAVCMLPGSASAQETLPDDKPLIIVVDGVGAVLINPAAARDEAIRDALRRAVEQAVGITIKGRTLMVDLQVVEDRVTGRAEGFVRSYEVVDESRVADLYRVRIEAVVDPSLLVDDLEGFGALLRLSLGNPRLLVVAGSEDGQRDEPEVQRLLVDHLVERQFLVVSADQLAAINSNAAIRHQAELATMARTIDADLVVTATVSSDYGGTMTTDHNRIVTERVTVALQAVLASTGQIVASRTSTSTRASTSLSAARSDAVEAAVAMALPQFTLDTIAVLNDSVSGSGSAQSIRVRVVDVTDFGTALRIRELLSAVRGVDTIQQRQFDGSNVTFDLQGSATSEEVAVHMASLADLRILVSYLDSQRLDLVLEGD